MKKLLTLVMLLLLILSVIPGLKVKAGWSGKTIYIKADGSIEPSYAPIRRDGNLYVLTDDINITLEKGIVIERNNIILDGDNHVVNGPGGDGIYLKSSKNVVIRKIKVKGFGTGIYLYSSPNSTITGSIISNNNYGILLFDSPNTIISNNTISNNRWYGINLRSSSGSTITNNIFTGCGLSILNSYSNIIKNNTVNDKPLVYLESVHNVKVSDAGQVILVKCNGIKVENLYLSNTTLGIELCESSNCTVANNIIVDYKWCGIRLHSSSHNTIANNTIINTVFNEPRWGVFLFFSSNNFITDNVFTGCGLLVSNSYFNTVLNNKVNGKPLAYLENAYNVKVNNAGQVILVKCKKIMVENINISKTSIGIELYESSDCTIDGNTISNNNYGIYLYSSFNNIIYHNNFIANYYHVSSHESVNTWDNGYPSGGNYWSDYSDVDQKSGRDQDKAGSDGIWDRPYVIDANNKDRYPSVKPFSTYYSPNLSTKGKRILFDISHVEQFTFWREDCYFELSKVLENEGYYLYQIGLDQFDEIEISSELLGYFDVLVLPHPQTSEGYFTSSEISTIVSFVERGGGLLILGGDYLLDEVSYPVKDLISYFGIEYEVPRKEFKSHVLTINETHPIMKNVNELYVSVPSALTIKRPAIGIVYLGEKPIIAVSEYGEGRVAVISCEYIFTKISGGNLQFGLNLFHWLSEKAPLHKEPLPQARITGYHPIIKTLELGERYEIEIGVENLGADELSVTVTIPNEPIFNKTGVGVGNLLGESKNISLKPGEEGKVSLFIESETVGYCYLSCYISTKLLGIPLLLDGMDLEKVEIVCSATQHFINVSSVYGTTIGSGEYLKGSTITISISPTQIDHGNGTRHVFSGWYEDGNLLSKDSQYSIIVKRSTKIVAAWDTQYFVMVSSPYGIPTSSGWYRKDNTAMISIPAFIEKDFFTNVVFEGWKVDGSIVSTLPTYSFVVDKPVTLVASWRTEVKPFAIGLIAGLILIIIVPAAVLMARRRKPSLPLPPTPPESETEKEIKKYEEYLEKLEQLRKEGKVSETAYEKLKAEYEKKIEELIDKLRK
ncbi:right-handed parallel beta-helix repeat-containing protein [Candidatus Bathyarchaeota archaeon]|nr:right-handed parallel beta-helix repeat-containing protein [Candidatus Bathyarchaeota archaeon]